MKKRRSGPRRHRILVEVTDMSGNSTTKQLAEMVRWMLAAHLRGAELTQLRNLQVKDFARYLQGKNYASPTACHRDGFGWKDNGPRGELKC